MNKILKTTQLAALTFALGFTSLFSQVSISLDNGNFETAVTIPPSNDFTENIVANGGTFVQGWTVASTFGHGGIIRRSSVPEGSQAMYFYLNTTTNNQTARFNQQTSRIMALNETYTFSLFVNDGVAAQGSTFELGFLSGSSLLGTASVFSSNSDYGTTGYTRLTTSYTTQASDVGNTLGVYFGGSYVVGNTGLEAINVDNATLTVAVVPEPSTGFALVGFAGIALYITKRGRALQNKA